MWYVVSLNGSFKMRSIYLFKNFTVLNRNFLTHSLIFVKCFDRISYVQISLLILKSNCDILSIGLFCPLATLSITCVSVPLGVLYFPSSRYPISLMLARVSLKDILPPPASPSHRLMEVRYGKNRLNPSQRERERERVTHCWMSCHMEIVKFPLMRVLDGTPFSRRVAVTTEERSSALVGGKNRFTKPYDEGIHRVRRLD